MNFIFCSFVKLNKKKCSKLALFSIQVTKESVEEGVQNLLL